MNRFVLCLLLILLCLPVTGVAQSVLSPDGKIVLTVSVEKGRAQYMVSADRNVVIRESGFGFALKNQPSLGDNVAVVRVTRTSIDESWEPVAGTSSSIRNSCNEATFTFRESGNLQRTFDCVARAYNDGVAFRFVFPNRPGEDSMFVTAENTSFSFPSNDSAWWIPAGEFAYESLYRHTPIGGIPDANTPITIETRNGFSVSIHEAALADYSEMVLRRSPDDSLTLRASLWPEPDGICARVKLPFRTPWRVIMIGRKPGDLIESHLIENLNDPCTLSDVSWITPMKFIGVWWGMQIGQYTWIAGPRHGATTERTKHYIDWAAAHHMGGVLAEGWNIGWETWAPDRKTVQDYCKGYPDFDLAEVARYAASKNIAFIAHHETGGNIPGYERQLDSAFALLEKLGIPAVKTGYAGSIVPEGYHHHGQYMVRHFQKVVETAAKHHVSLDVHEAIKPTGLSRTWPNLLTQEAIRGNEWNATYRATPPYHAAILPFTRFLAGPADYTPGIFKIVYNPDKNMRLYCTIGNQLAMFVVFYSPLMMVSDMIENYENHPAFRFVEDVPSTWDETTVVAASIGHYVAIARRKGDRWFTGTLTDESSRLVKLPLSFLENGMRYTATIYGDSIATRWDTNPDAIEVGRYSVTGQDTIYAAVSSAGGHVVEFIPDSSGNSTTLPPITLYNKEAITKMGAFVAINPFGNTHVNHLALHKPVTLALSYSQRYPASGVNALTDGDRGTINYTTGGWQGFEGSDIDATIDLQAATPIHRIRTGFLNSTGDWIFVPKQVEFFVSSDGKDFKKAGNIDCTPTEIADTNRVCVREFSVDVDRAPVRFVRMVAHSIITCPDWHPGRGGKAWLFCDEIIVE